MDKADPVILEAQQMVTVEDINRAIAQLKAETVTGATAAETELEGSWLVSDAMLAGDSAPQIVDQCLTFKGNRFEITKDGALLYGGTFELDRIAGTPAIEFDQYETQTLAGIWRGIYAVIGDTLMICDNAPAMAQPRPKGFADVAMAGYVLIHYTRQD